MKSKNTLFFILLCLVFFNGKPLEEAINLTGHWKGFLWQTQGGIARKYGFEMWIKQDNNKISGTSYIYLLNNPKSFAKMNFFGNCRHRNANFQEQQILQKQITTGKWCIKNGSLFYEKKNQIRTLSGTWFGCKTAHTQEDRIYLEKVK